MNRYFIYRLLHTIPYSVSYESMSAKKLKPLKQVKPFYSRANAPELYGLFP